MASVRAFVALGATLAFMSGCACSRHEPAAAAPTATSTAAAEPPKVTERRELRAMIDERIAAADRGDAAGVAHVDAEIRRRFEHPLAVMVTDMSGFTRKTKSGGIVAFLASVRRLFHLADPLVVSYGAHWVKVDADDLFITHEEPQKLFDLAVALQAAIAKWNAEHHDDIGLSVGLGYGPTLVVEHDVWGNSVNTASKLGEDIGEAGEILASDEFRATLDAARASRCTPSEEGARGSKVHFHLCK